MKRVIILGQTNAGKTLFTINFAAYLGVQSITFTFSDKQRGSYTRTIEIQDAIELLVSDRAHHTRSIQSAVLQIPWGKAAKRFEILDTAGLSDGIHSDETVRRGMAYTLATVREAEIILHVLDSALIAKKNVLHSIGEVDYQVAQFGQLHTGYAILANKIDVPHVKEGLDKICEEFPGHFVIPISALLKLGFKEVRDFVKRHL